MVGNLGRIAEAQLGGRDQPKDGNYLYGAVGHDFETREGRRVMVVALTARQWLALKEATGIGDACEKLAQATGHDLDTETGRFESRDLIAALLRPWFAAHDLAEIRERFAGTGVSWGPYQTFRQLVDEDPRVSDANPMFATVEQSASAPTSSPVRRWTSPQYRASPPAERRCSASTPKRSSPTCSGCQPRRSVRCTTAV
jgi:2-methylfumaryl-CoA isomerase